MQWSLVFAWLMFCIGLGALALPLVSALCVRLPDRGASIALPTSLAVVGLVTYWVGHVSFGLPAIALGALVLASASGFLYWRGVEVPLRGYGEATAVFAAGFLFVVLVRATSPAILPGTENFLNMGLLQSLLRAPALPPEDMWFAGERVRYYYGGHLIAAVLAKLTATPGRFAYNLALPVFYGSLLAAAFGAGRGIVADREVSGRLAGGLSAFFVGIASNLFAPVGLLLSALPSSVADPIVSLLDVPARSLGGYGLYAPVHFSFTNTDFPLYSVFLGTLHAHVMSTPFLVSGIVLLVAYYRTPEDETRRRRLLVLALAVAAAVVGLVNTWSLPTALGLVAVTFALAPTRPRTLLRMAGGARGSAAAEESAGPSEVTDLSGRGLLVRSGTSLGIVAGIGLVALVLGFPFFLGGTPGGLGIGLLPDRAPWHYFLLAYGSVLFVFALYVFPRAGTAIGERGRRLAIISLVVLVAVGFLADFHGLAIVAPIGIAGLYLAASDSETGYEAILIVAGAGLVLLVELLYVREPAEPGRFNTAYKTYMQAFLIWGVAAGTCLARIIEDLPNPTVDLLGGRWRAELVVVLLVASLSLYGAGWVATAGTDPGVTPGLTLDGISTLEPGHADQIAGVEWLLDRPGRPRIVSAPATPGRMYSFNASIASSLTGFPTIVGWAHERDYRNATAYRRRVTHVDTIYLGSPRQRAHFLDRWNVEYVWVGPGERQRYGNVTLDPAAEPWLTAVFHRGSVTVYAVNGSALPGAG